VADPAAPLILTLALDGEAFAVFDGLRREHFPPERNVVPAHVTLFHALPGEQRSAIGSLLGLLCRRQKPVAVSVTGLRFMGRGVAFSLESPALQALRRELAGEWSPWLTPQDGQRFQPHVTIQNKVAPEEARALHRRLSAEFEPFAFRGEGLILWRYLGGPWERIRLFRFTA
jgi:2'-5' RNA ligase